MNILKFKMSIVILLVALGLVACGGDGSAGSAGSPTLSPTGAGNEESSCVNTVAADDSCSKNSSSSMKKSDDESSSSKKSDYVCKIYTQTDALRCACDEEHEGKISLNVEKNIEFKCSYDEYLNQWGWVELKAESSSSSEEAKSSSSSDVVLRSSSSTSVRSSSSLVALEGTSCTKEGYVRMDEFNDYFVQCVDGVYTWYWELGENHDYFVDERDGQRYAYATVEHLTVMVQNLNYGKPIPGGNKENQSDDSVVEKFCYNDDSISCAHYGGLYQWHEAMGLPVKCMTSNEGECAVDSLVDRRGICPEGWHIPSLKDWGKMVNYGTSVQTDYRVTHYWSTGAGLNKNGFSALPAGIRTSTYEGSEYGYMFEATFYWLNGLDLYTENESKALSSYLFEGMEDVMMNYMVYFKDAALSIRCVKD